MIGGGWGGNIQNTFKHVEVLNKLYMTGGKSILIIHILLIINKLVTITMRTFEVQSKKKQQQQQQFKDPAKKVAIRFSIKAKPNPLAGILISPFTSAFCTRLIEHFS